MDDLDELRSLRRIEQALDEMALLFARRAAEVRAAKAAALVKEGDE